MNREELKGKQTDGLVMFSTMDYPCVMRANHPQWNTADISQGLPNGFDETMANGTLYAEAHNMANDTGMWPIDMVHRIKELEDALLELVVNQPQAHTDPFEPRVKAEERARSILITKAPIKHQ